MTAKVAMQHEARMFERSQVRRLQPSMVGITMASLPEMIASADSLDSIDEEPVEKTLSEPLSDINDDEDGESSDDEWRGLCEVDMDNHLPDEDTDTWVAPWISLKKSATSTSAKPCPTNGYHIGMTLKLFSVTAGTDVDAIVTDCQGDDVKVMYLIGGRCFTKVLSQDEIPSQETNSGGLIPTVGTPVLVRSTTVNTWFKGTVLECDGMLVKVHWWHNGQSLTKVLSKTSPDLQVCYRKPHTMATKSATKSWSPFIIAAADVPGMDEKVANLISVP